MKIQNLIIIIIISITGIVGTANAAITYDQISVPHNITFGTPQPTDNANNGVNFKTTNVYNFDLKDFPFNNLPSGGTSGKLSSSEMAMTSISMDDWFFVNDNITITWYKNSKVLYTSNCGLSHSCSSYIGHFGWEINEPGYYYVQILTTRGNAEIGFNVINSSKSISNPTPQPTTPRITPQPIKTTPPVRVKPMPVVVTPQPTYNPPKYNPPTYNSNNDPNIQQAKDVVQTFGSGVGMFFKWFGEGVINGIRNG